MFIDLTQSVKMEQAALLIVSAAVFNFLVKNEIVGVKLHVAFLQTSSLII